MQSIEERLSALGNVISCNDYVALTHPDVDHETEDPMSDVFGVKVCRQTVASQALVGSYSFFIIRGEWCVIELLLMMVRS